jgi:hypothetical protein
MNWKPILRNAVLVTAFAFCLSSLFRFVVEGHVMWLAQLTTALIAFPLFTLFFYWRARQMAGREEQRPQ